MSEQHLPTPELQLLPQEALRAYLNVGAGAEMGAASLEELTSWQVAVRKARLKPDQQLHAGWISVEQGFRTLRDSQAEANSNANQTQAEAVEIVSASLGEAQEIFGAIIDKPGANAKVKAQAILAHGSIPLYRALLCGDNQAMTKGFQDFYRGHFEAGSLLLHQWQRFGNITDVPLLHSLAVMTLVNKDLHENRFALPAPARTMEADTDAKDSWSFLLWNLAGSNYTYRTRIAATGPNNMICISPALLQNGNYPSKHGQGTLQSLIDDNQKRQRMGVPPRFASAPPVSNAPGSQKNAASTPGIQQQITSGIATHQRYLGEADTHIGTVSKVLRNEIGTYLDANEPQVKSREGESVDLAFEYLNIPAHWHSSQLSERALNGLASIFENANTGELDPSHKVILAWLHLELGVKAATEQEMSASLAGAFDRAEDLFGEASEELLGTDRHILGYESRISQLAAGIYKAVSLGEAAGIDTDEALQTYNKGLAEIGLTMLAEFSLLEDYTTQLAAELNYNIHLVNIMLAASAGTSGGNIAALSTLRQRGLTADNNNGWHINIWPLSANGFKPDLHGKIRLDKNDNPASIDSNIVTISRHTLNPTGNFEMLCSLIDMVNDEGANPSQAQITEAAIAKITSAAEISNW